MGDPKIPDIVGRADEQVFEDTPMVPLPGERGISPGVPEKGVNPHQGDPAATEERMFVVKSSGSEPKIGMAPKRPEELAKNASQDEIMKSVLYWKDREKRMKDEPKRVGPLKDKLEALYDQEAVVTGATPVDYKEGTTTIEELAPKSWERIEKGDPEAVARRRREMYEGKTLPPTGSPEETDADYSAGRVTPEELAEAARWSHDVGVKTNDPKERVRAYRRWRQE